VWSYPSTHVEALADKRARARLLTGTHSLWYEYICFELHRALADLDTAQMTVPDPVRIAVTAELAKELDLLRMAVAESDGTEPAPTEGVERLWVFDAPMVRFEGGMEALGSEVRENLDKYEEHASDEERAVAVEDLRLLATVETLCRDVDYLHFEPGYLDLSYDPYDREKLFVNINAPEPGPDGPTVWSIDIDRWVPVDPDVRAEDIDEDYEGTMTGQGMVSCVLPARPSVESLVDLLSRLGREPQLLTQMVKTAEVGSPLIGTEFVVTTLGED
jgi:hypothetical protein